MTRIAGYPEMQAVISALSRTGHNPDADIAWAEAIAPPTDPHEFAMELIFVICNSGMKHTVAQGIFERVMRHLIAGNNPKEAFHHAGKCKAIKAIWDGRVELLAKYQAATDKLAFLESLPWIGAITKYHAAKNFGLQVAKPDVHMTRLAETFNTTPQVMCEIIAKRSGYKVATVDTLLWRAAAVGVLDTSTGMVLP